MSTGPGHYREAERLLAEWADKKTGGRPYQYLVAQVHATLALAAPRNAQATRSGHWEAVSRSAQADLRLVAAAIPGGSEAVADALNRLMILTDSLAGLDTP